MVCVRFYHFAQSHVVYLAVLCYVPEVSYFYPIIAFGSVSFITVFYHLPDAYWVVLSHLVFYCFIASGILLYVVVLSCAVTGCASVSCNVLSYLTHQHQLNLVVPQRFISCGIWFNCILCYCIMLGKVSLGVFSCCDMSCHILFIMLCQVLSSVS